LLSAQKIPLDDLAFRLDHPAGFVFFDWCMLWLDSDHSVFLPGHRVDFGSPLKAFSSMRLIVTRLKFLSVSSKSAQIPAQMAALSPGRGNDCDDQANVRTVLLPKQSEHLLESC